MTQIIFGIDVSKHKFDIYSLCTKEEWCIATADMESWLKQNAIENVLMVFEATGIYSKRLGKLCHQHNIAFAQANPRHIRRYAQACGILAKNDRIDAAVIANFAKNCGITKSDHDKLYYEELRDLVTRRQQVSNMITQEKGHVETTDSPIIMKMINANIKTLKVQMKELEKDINTLLKDIKQAEILTSVPGIGTTTAASILAYLPEIGQANRKEIAALAGLAPYVRDSGTLRGKRSIYGGRAQVRRALYMATLVAIKRNPLCKDWYDKLIERGKPFKVAITAVMRKLLLVLNNMCKNETLWQG